MLFKNNTASLFGNEIFGATFQFCPWLNYSISEDGVAILTYLEKYLGDVIYFNERLTVEQNVVNGYLNSVYFDSLPSSIMPGQLFRANITTLDFFNQTVPSVSTLRRTDSDGRLDTSGRFTADGNLVTFIEESKSSVLCSTVNLEKRLHFNSCRFLPFDPRDVSTLPSPNAIPVLSTTIP